MVMSYFSQPDAAAQPARVADGENGSITSGANRRTEEVIANPTWSQPRDAIHRAAMIEI